MSKKIIRVYLLFNWIYFFFLSLEFSTYVLFLKQNNLTFAEIGIVNGVFMLAVFALEIPTGIIADYFGRKISVLFGVFFSGIGTFIYFLSTGLLGFIVAEIIIAFGMSCISGALDAWVKDTLDFNGCKEKMTNVFSKGDIASRSAALFGGLVGGLIGNYDLRLPWLLTAIGLILSTFVLAGLIKEEYFKKEPAHGIRGSLRQMKTICVDSVKYGYQNKFIWNLILMNTIFVLGTQAFNMQWSPLFEKKIGLWSMGWIYVVFSLAIILGIVLANWRMRKGSAEKTVLFFSIFATGVAGLLATVFDNGYIILGFFLIHEAGRGGFNPVQKALVQENIPSDKRATIGSFNSMVVRLGAAVGWMGSGFLADHVSIQTCWFISSLFFFLALPFVWKVKAK
jgi:MFS family permease